MAVQASATSRVEWVDTDAAGHHHNTAIVRFVEAAEAELARRHGLTGYFGAAPRVHHSVDYESRLFFGQVVTAVVTVERIGTSSMTFAFEVWGEAFEQRPRQRAARGRFVVAHVPGPGGGAEPWPADWVRRLGGVDGRPPEAPPPVGS